MKAARILLAAGASGSGKTLITCGLLQALVNRGLKTASFKCGPDYIDPMFHSRVLGVPSRNIDLFLQGKAGVRAAFKAADGDIGRRDALSRHEHERQRTHRRIDGERGA